MYVALTASGIAKYARTSAAGSDASAPRPGIAGKLTSIVTMIVGISLFVKLAQAVFRPNKVFYECTHCGLRRHEPDAVHCKACGNLLKIPDDGVF